MTRKQLIQALERRGACDVPGGGLPWVRATKGTPKQLWEKCPTAWKEWLGMYVTGPGHAFCVVCDRVPVDAVPWELVEAFLAADYDGGGR